MTQEDRFCLKFEPTAREETEHFTSPLDLSVFISTYLFICCGEKAP